MKAEERFGASTVRLQLVLVSLCVCSDGNYGQHYHVEVHSQVGVKTVPNKTYADFEVLHRNMKRRVRP